MNDRVHLRRLECICVSHPVYFITSCTVDRHPLLASPRVTEILRNEWERARDHHGWLIGRYVVMPDHVHFFCAEVAGGSRHSLSRFVGAWKEWTAKGLVRSLGLSAPVWQTRFFDHLLRTDESYADKWAYVRENPVRAGLVEDSGSWPFQGWVDFDMPR